MAAKSPSQYKELVDRIDKSVNPPVIALVCKVVDVKTGKPIAFEDAEKILVSFGGNGLAVTRSYPGAPDSTGWTVFHHKQRMVSHEGDPLFKSELECRKYIWQTYPHNSN